MCLLLVLCLQESDEEETAVLTEDSMEVEGSDANNSASEADSHTDIIM